MPRLLLSQGRAPDLPSFPHAAAIARICTVEFMRRHSIGLTLLNTIQIEKKMSREVLQKEGMSSLSVEMTSLLS